MVEIPKRKTRPLVPVKIISAMTCWKFREGFLIGFIELLVSCFEAMLFAQSLQHSQDMVGIPRPMGMGDFEVHMCSL